MEILTYAAKGVHYFAVAKRRILPSPYKAAKEQSKPEMYVVNHFLYTVSQPQMLQIFRDQSLGSVCFSYTGDLIAYDSRST